MAPDVQVKRATFPEDARRHFDTVRRLILSVAEENALGVVEESLKWGEPSYSVAGGSPIRIDWKPEAPDSLSVFFHCQTRLIETFREVYPEAFEYQGKRAIVLPLESPVSEEPLSHCIELALKYHSVKHLPLLGA